MYTKAKRENNVHEWRLLRVESYNVKPDWDGDKLAYWRNYYTTTKRYLSRQPLIRKIIISVVLFFNQHSTISSKTSVRI